MFELYSEAARRSIFLARYEAANQGQPEIKPHHILLGLLRESVRLKELFGFQPNFEDVRREITATEPVGRSSKIDLPLDNPSKRVLAYAAEEMKATGHESLQPEHLFLGLLREERSFAAEILARRSITLDDARKKVSALPSQPPTLIRGRALLLPRWLHLNEVVATRRWLLIVAAMIAFAVGVFVATVWWLTRGM